MKKLLLKFAALACVLTGPLSAQAGNHHNHGSPFFMPPSCNVRLAFLEFKERLGEMPRPTSDGYFPWSTLMGYWTDPSRDLVISVTPATIGDQENLSIQFHSLCSGRLLASGLYKIQRGQGRQPKTQLLVSMVMNDIEGTPVSTMLTLIKPHSNRLRSLSVTVKEEEAKRIIADTFEARKF